jgi:hypothetical protein
LRPEELVDLAPRGVPVDTGLALLDQRRVACRSVHQKRGNKKKDEILKF